MKTYENNMADQALVVKSLKVLDKVEGGAFKEIKQNVEAVRKQTNVISRQQEEYWKTLSDDGIITPIEKQSLLRESKNIDRSFAAITQQAATLGIASAILEDYIATYDALHAYLFTTLKLFDDMQSETNIDDRDTFNAYFSGYYFSENFVLLAITAGILDTIDFRVLQSLTEPGEEGEAAIYHGALYQYVDGVWKNVTTGAYKGPRTELPPDEEEAFFIVSNSFTMSESLIVNDEELLVNSDTLLVTHTYLKGYIYYFQAGTWHPEWDKTNWRYAAAFADVINITGELPQLFQDGLDAIQANLDAAVLTLEDEIAAKQGQYTIIGGEMVLIDDLLPDIVDEYNQQQAEIDSKVSHLPEYFGGTNTSPASPQEGDFYLFTGSGSDNCKVKRYHNGAWETLDPSNTYYRNYYMMALQDILANTNAGTATFSNAFAQNFWAACASMDSLDVKTIYLRQNGKIQSANLTYSEEQVGLKIDSDGNIDANGNTHIKGKVAIGVSLSGNSEFNTYDTIIGSNSSNTKIGGNTQIDGTVLFKGSIQNDGFSITKKPVGSQQLLYRSDKNNMEHGSIIYLIAKLLDLDITNWDNEEKSFDVTLVTKVLYIYNASVGLSHDVDKLEIHVLRSSPPRSLIVNFAECIIRVHTTSGNWIYLLNDYNPDSEYGASGWERLVLSGLTTIALYAQMSNYAELKYGVLPAQESSTNGVMWDDNGLIKISGKNQPWKYFEFDDYTDYKYVYDLIKPYMTNNYCVSCLGYYGTSDSSHDRDICAIKSINGNLVFVNHNNTAYLTIPSNVGFGDGLLDGKLAILFLSV